MSIKQYLDKIKLFKLRLEKREIFAVMVIILGCSASFGLGRLSSLEDTHEALSIVNYPKSVAEVTVPALSNDTSAAVINSTQTSQATGLYVASKNGKKYFYPWCGGAKSISEANKIWFESKAAALAAGYTPAANCKGLN